MKLIFFQLSQLEKYQNINIEFHQPELKDKVLNLDSTQEENAGHFNVLRNLKNKKIYLYYADQTLNPFQSKTCLAISNDGITFIKPKTKKEIEDNIILSRKCFSYNMNAFIDPSAPSSEKYKAIGGLHASSWHLKEYGQEINPKIKFMYLKPILNLNPGQDIYSLPHPAFLKRKRLKSRKQKYDDDTSSMFMYLDPTQNDPYFNGNGLQMYVSEDGLNWKSKFQIPILDGMQEGHYDGLYMCSYFDGHPNCFYDPFQNNYVIYVRSNLQSGVSHIQLARSQDLTQWTPLEFVNFNPTFDLSSDNFYSMNAIPYPNSSDPIYMAFPSYYQNKSKESQIKIAWSSDGSSWKIKDWIKRSIKHSRDRFQGIMASGLILSNDQSEFYLYEHNKKEKGLIRYAISRDRFTSISAKSNLGFFQTRPFIFKKSIKLNFRTLKGGYLNLEFLNKDQKTVSTIKNIKGNNLRLVVDVPSKLVKKKGSLKIILRYGDCYSIDV